MTAATVEAGPVTTTAEPGPAYGRLGALPRVDLMPAEVAEKVALRRLQGGCAAAVAVALVAVGGLYYQAHEKTQHAQTALASAQQSHDGMQLQVNRLHPVAAAYAQASAANALVGSTLAGEVRWSTYLADLGTTIPSNIWLTGMTVTAGSGSTATAGAATPIASISFQGTATALPGANPPPVRDSVATWLDALAKVPGFVDQTYSVSSEALVGTTKVVTFSSTVDVTSAALSHRYTTGSS